MRMVGSFIKSFTIKNYSITFFSQKVTKKPRGWIIYYEAGVACTRGIDAVNYKATFMVRVVYCGKA